MHDRTRIMRRHGNDEIKSVYRFAVSSDSLVIEKNSSEDFFFDDQGFVY